MALTILVDTREQKPWEFDDYAVELRRETLRTADYTLEEFCDYDEENDTYLPRFGVERKSGQDFLQSITHRRNNFEDEVQRAGDWDAPLSVIIEEPYSTFQNNLGFMQYRDVAPSHVSGTVEKWERWYNVEFKFVASRSSAQQHCYDTLLTQRRAVRQNNRSA